MSIEIEAVGELYELTYQGIKYTFKFAKGFGKTALSALGLIQSALNGDLRTKGATKIETLLRQKSGIATFALNEKDFKVFQRQAKKMGILYVATSAENGGNNDQMITLVTGSDDAYRVNHIIAINQLDGIETGGFEKSEAEEKNRVPQPEDTPEAGDAESGGAAVSEQPEQPEEPASEEAKAVSEDFFAAFDEPEQPENGPEPEQDTSAGFFTAFQPVQPGQREQPKAPEPANPTKPRQEKNNPSGEKSGSLNIRSGTRLTSENKNPPPAPAVPLLTAGTVKGTIAGIKREMAAAKPEPGQKLLPDTQKGM